MWYFNFDAIYLFLIKKTFLIYEYFYRHNITLLN